MATGQRRPCWSRQRAKTLVDASLFLVRFSRRAALSAADHELARKKPELAGYFRPSLAATLPASARCGAAGVIPIREASTPPAERIADWTACARLSPRAWRSASDTCIRLSN